MEKKIKRNQDGSVILAVVCMSMICITLATIALGVVKATTKASSRNVQRTQAKITAEAALTEFIQSYNNNYDALKALATSGDGTAIDVKMPADSDFNSTYGTVTLHVKKNGTNGFKVISECTFSTQTQSASVVFDSVKETPNIPSNALEASEGANFSDGVASPIDGDICLEKKTSAADMNYITLGCNNAAFTSHIYSEYNLYFNSGTSFSDVINKSGSLNYEPNKSNAAKAGNFFKQAMTITTEGYMFFYNQTTISTAIGKTDVNGKNSDDAGYDASNLSNRDGYIKADKKIWLGMPNALTIGDSSKPIDMYTHGLYVGTLPQNLAGSTNPDYSAMMGGYDNNVGGQTAAGTVNGNVYCYIGNNATYQSGDMVICNGAQTFTVNGDLFVEGNLYIRVGSDGGSKLNVSGTLHCNKNILFIDDGGNVVSTVGINNGAFQSISNQPGYDGENLASRQISCGSKDVTIDKTGRNAYPNAGYDPASGVDNTKRSNLKSMYGMASANDMFGAYFGTDTDLADASKNIAKKYAEALTRTVNTKKFVRADGATVADLVNVYQTGSKRITQINGSLRLRGSDFGNMNVESERKKYSVKLTTEDIVIALPIDKGNVTPFFRIDSSEAADGVFVYFMYYEENTIPDFSDADQDNNVLDCLYFNGTATSAQVTVDAISVYDNSSKSFTSQKVIFNKTDDSYRNGKSIVYNSNGQDIDFCSDSALYYPYTSTRTDTSAITGGTDNRIKFDEYYNLFGQKLPANVCELGVNGDGSTTVEGYTNRIFYLVPSSVSVTFGDNLEMQGIMYATKSLVTFQGSHTRFYGQVKCGTYRCPNDDKVGIVKNIPAAKQSILDYVSEINKQHGSSSDIEIMYYDYSH